MSIWARNHATGIAEKIDDGNSEYLAGEYRMAFGRGWTIWTGRKKDEPGRES
jgi:hypothetical protein